MSDANRERDRMIAVGGFIESALMRIQQGDASRASVLLTTALSIIEKLDVECPGADPTKALCCGCGIETASVEVPVCPACLMRIVR